MADPDKEHAPFPGGGTPARELLVPAIMLTSLLLYSVDARHLSIEALIFPIVLGAVVITGILVAVVGLLLRWRLAMGEDEGPVAQLRPWLLLAVPVVLVAALNLIGAFVALFLIVLGGQFVLGARSALRSATIALVVMAPIYFLFKHMLYVRLPAGLFGLG